MKTFNDFKVFRLLSDKSLQGPIMLRRREIFKDGFLIIRNHGCSNQVATSCRCYVVNHAIRQERRLSNETDYCCKQCIRVGWLDRRLIQLLIYKLHSGNAMLQGLRRIVNAAVLGQV